MQFGATRSVLACGATIAFLVAGAADAHAQSPRAPHAPPAHAPTKPATKEAPNPNKTRAAELFKKSADAYLHGDFAQAVALLDEAYALDPQPVLVYNKARAHEGLGHIDEAILSYEKYLADEPSSPDRGAIEQRLVTLRHQRDERAALAKDRAAVQTERAAVEKERATVTEPPPEAPRRRSVLPYVVMGAGGLGLIGGAVFGLMAKSREDDATSEPVQRTSIELRDTGETFATVSNISFIAGGALVAAGAVWWVLDMRASKRHGTSAMPVQVGLGPSFITVGGALP